MCISLFTIVMCKGVVPPISWLHWDILILSYCLIPGHPLSIGHMIKGVADVIIDVYQI